MPPFYFLQAKSDPRHAFPGKRKHNYFNVKIFHKKIYAVVP